MKKERTGDDFESQELIKLSKEKEATQGSPPACWNTGKAEELEVLDSSKGTVWAAERTADFLKVIFPD